MSQDKLVPLLWEQIDTSEKNSYIPSVSDDEMPRAFQSLKRSESASGSLRLPQHNELNVVRHFTRLSQLNFSIDSNMYPLGSCTMKYNPRVNDTVASNAAFATAHPDDAEDAQGSLEVLYMLQQQLAVLSGFSAVALSPAAGAQGELTGVMMIRKYHESRGDHERNVIIVPDTAHGTNPATVSMCGMKVKTVPSNSEGHVDMEAFKAILGPDVAGMMLTNPNTLGLFESDVVEICSLIHQAGGLMYGDGANFNAIAGVVRPAELGFDVMHFNLHKTFGTPHGGGGPGAGPVGCTETLAEFLPGPVIAMGAEKYTVETPKNSIGRMKTGFGNFGILLRAFSYISAHGKDGVRRNSEMAVLKANYLRNLLSAELPAHYPGKSMHEFVAGNPVKEFHVTTMDIAKALLDHGFHSPTVYFPLTVKEALMIEPTESESFEEIEAFANTLITILRTAQSDPESVQKAPITTVLGRLDEVKANRHPVLKHSW